MSDPGPDLDPAPSRWFDLLVAAAVGAGLLLLSELLVPGAEQPFAGHGERFATMAEDPFARTGDFPQRLLWPLLAWLFAKVGVSAVAFSQVCNALLLAVVFWFVLRRTGQFVDGLLVAAVVACSGAVLVYKPMACMSDPLSLLTFVLLVHFARRGAVFWPLVFVSALSHEMVFFFWPWLLYLRCRNGGAWWRDGAFLGITLAAYLAFRVQTTASYGTSYYLEKAFWFPWCMPAMWGLWAFVVLVEFGPLLTVVAWGLGRRGALSAREALGGRWGGWLYLAGVLPLMILAYDVMRFATFAFLPVVLAATALVRRRGGRLLVAALLAAAIPCYAWLHPVPSQQGGRHFTEISAHIYSLLPGRVVPRQPMALEHAWTFSLELLGRWWWPLGTAALLALLSMLALGWVLRLRFPPR
ncbi:MAG: hypothetical protein ACE37K_07230 [Planctomycetota bacterium]